MFLICSDVLDLCFSIVFVSLFDSGVFDLFWCFFIFVFFCFLWSVYFFVHSVDESDGDLFGSYSIGFLESVVDHCQVCILWRIVCFCGAWSSLLWFERGISL